MKIDVIVPIYFTNKEFNANVKSWFEAIPIKNLIIGLAKEDESVREILSMYKGVTIIDQMEHKTLGYCIKELVSEVKGKWFIFLHDDVKLMKGWFENMWMQVKLFDGDIMESLKELTSYNRIRQAKSWRPYSGAQLIKKAIYDLVMYDIEDDFVYTTEDIILYIKALENGFKYCKVPIFHEHQGRTYETQKGERSLRTLEYADSLFLSVQALVKYCPPIKIIQNMVNGIFKTLKKEIIGDWNK